MANQLIIDALLRLHPVMAGTTQKDAAKIEKVAATSVGATTKAYKEQTRAVKETEKASTSFANTRQKVTKVTKDAQSATAKYQGQITKSQASIANLTKLEGGQSLVLGEQNKINSARVGIIKDLSAKQMAGGKLTAQQTQLLQKTSTAYNKTAKEITKAKDASGGMNKMSAASIAKMAQWAVGWTIMYGAMRLVTQGIGAVVRQMLDLDDSLARIMTVTRTGLSERSMRGIFSAEILGIATETRATINDTTKAVYHLGSAGLSVRQQLAGLQPIMDLTVGTVGNLDEVARLVAGSFNVFADGMTEISSDSEKFRLIVDNLTYAYTNNQIELSEVSNAMRYVGQTAGLINISYKELIQTIGFLGTGMLRGSRAGTCYDDKTEILTNGGFKYFNNLTINDEFATLNPKTHNLEYQKAIRFINENYEGLMYEVENKHLSLKVTPNHWIYSRKGNKNSKTKYEFNLPKDIFGQERTYIRGANWQGKEPKYFVLPSIKRNGGKNRENEILSEIKIPIKDFVEFMGYYLSEGNTNKYTDEKNCSSYRVCIAQEKNSKYFDEIKNCVSKSPFNSKYYRISHQFTFQNQQIFDYLEKFGKANEKYIPQEIKELSPKLLKIFLKSYAMGDGEFKGKGYRIVTGSLRMRDDLEEIALKSGFGVQHYRVRKAGENSRETWSQKTKDNSFTPQYDIWQIGITPRTEFSFYKQRKNVVNSPDIKENWVEYSGKIYCVEVPNHIIFVRRNGKTVWGVNSLMNAIVATASKGNILYKQLNLIFDPRAPINFVGLMRQLHDRFGEGKIAARDLADLVQVFGRRGVRAIADILGRWGQYIKSIEVSDKLMEGASVTARDFMNMTIKGQMQILANNLKISLYSEDISYNFKNILANINASVTPSARLTSETNALKVLLREIKEDAPELAKILSGMKPPLSAWREFQKIASEQTLLKAFAFATEQFLMPLTEKELVLEYKVRGAKKARESATVLAQIYEDNKKILDEHPEVLSKIEKINKEWLKDGKEIGELWKAIGVVLAEVGGKVKPINDAQSQILLSLNKQLLATKRKNEAELMSITGIKKSVILRKTETQELKDIKTELLDIEDKTWKLQYATNEYGKKIYATKEKIDEIREAIPGIGEEFKRIAKLPIGKQAAEITKLADFYYGAIDIENRSISLITKKAVKHALVTEEVEKQLKLLEKQATVAGIAEDIRLNKLRILGAEETTVIAARKQGLEDTIKGYEIDLSKAGKTAAQKKVITNKLEKAKQEFQRETGNLANAIEDKNRKKQQESQEAVITGIKRVSEIDQIRLHTKEATQTEIYDHEIEKSKEIEKILRAQLLDLGEQDTLGKKDLENKIKLAEHATKIAKANKEAAKDAERKLVYDREIAILLAKAELYGETKLDQLWIEEELVKSSIRLTEGQKEAKRKEIGYRRESLKIDEAKLEQDRKYVLIAAGVAAYGGTQLDQLNAQLVVATKLREESGSLVESEKERELIYERQKELLTEQEQIVSSIKSTTVSGMQDLINGTGTWADLLGDINDIFLQKCLETLMDMVFQARILKTIMGVMSGIFGGGGGEQPLPGLSVARGAAQAEGGIMPGGFTPIRQFAQGSIVTRPTLGIVGEGKYDEAVIPLSRGRSIPVEMKGGGESQRIVNVSLSVSAIDAANTYSFLNKNKGMIASMLQGAIKDNHPLRRGGGV